MVRSRKNAAGHAVEPDGMIVIRLKSLSRSLQKTCKHATLPNHNVGVIPHRLSEIMSTTPSGTR